MSAVLEKEVNLDAWQAPSGILFSHHSPVLAWGRWQIRQWSLADHAPFSPMGHQSKWKDQLWCYLPFLHNGTMLTQHTKGDLTAKVDFKNASCLTPTPWKTAMYPTALGNQRTTSICNFHSQVGDSDHHVINKTCSCLVASQLLQHIFSYSHLFLEGWVASKTCMKPTQLLISAC